MAVSFEGERLTKGPLKSTPKFEVKCTSGTELSGLGRKNAGDVHSKLSIVLSMYSSADIPMFLGRLAGNLSVDGGSCSMRTPFSN